MIMRDLSKAGNKMCLPPDGQISLNFRGLHSHILPGSSFIGSHIAR